MEQDSLVAVVNKPGFLLTTSMDDKLFGFLGGLGAERLHAAAGWLLAAAGWLVAACCWWAAGGGVVVGSCW